LGLVLLALALAVLMDNFYRIPELKFDIDKLQEATNQVISRVPFEGDDPSIMLTHIPGDLKSTTGDNLVGQYWTNPDHDENEISVEKEIQEELYTEIRPEFEDTYFKYVYNKCSEKFRLGRVRLLLRTYCTMQDWHRDPEPRLNIPITTNPGALMIIDTEARHLPADGYAWLTNTVNYHTAINGGRKDRIHLIATVFDK